MALPTNAGAISRLRDIHFGQYAATLTRSAHLVMVCGELW